MAGVPTPRIDGIQLVALIVETLLYGVFFVLWVQCINILAERSRQQGERILKQLSFTAMFLFLTITGHWVLDCARAFQAFVLAQDHYNCDPAFPNAATIVYSDISDPKSVANSALYVVTTLVGDAFMVYRLFIVWGRNWWVIIPPSSLVVGLAVTGSATTYYFSKATPIFGTPRGWITASFVMTLLANLSSSGLIAFRIWLSNRRFKPNGAAKAVEIIVESAAIYSCCLVISLVSYAANSNIQFVGVSVNSPMVGIIFCMIVFRAYRSTNVSSGPVTTAPYQTSGGHRISRKSGSASQYQPNQPRPPMAIKITTEVDGPLHEEIALKLSNFSGDYPAAAKMA